jgi:hypothetical protein
MLVEGSIVPDRFVLFTPTLNPLKVRIGSEFQEMKPFYGKKLGILGTSTSVQNLYSNELLKATGMLEVLNLAESGALLRTRADSLTAGNIAGIDVLTMIAGGNDYGHGNSYLGSISDDKSVDTIYGSMKYVIDKILSLKPSVRFFVFTPTQCGPYLSEPAPPALNSYGLSVQSIGVAMMDVCRFVGVPCYDLGANCGINAYTISTMLQDGKHPTQAASDIIGKLMGNFINANG